MGVRLGARVAVAGLECLWCLLRLFLGILVFLVLRLIVLRLMILCRGLLLLMMMAGSFAWVAEFLCWIPMSAMTVSGLKILVRMRVWWLIA